MYCNNGWWKRKLENTRTWDFSPAPVNFLDFVPKIILYKRNKHLYKSLQRSYILTRAENKIGKSEMNKGGCVWGNGFIMYRRIYKLLYYILE